MDPLFSMIGCGGLTLPVESTHRRLLSVSCPKTKKDHGLWLLYIYSTHQTASYQARAVMSGPNHAWPFGWRIMIFTEQAITFVPRIVHVCTYLKLPNLANRFFPPCT